MKGIQKYLILAILAAGIVPLISFSLLKIQSGKSGKESVEKIGTSEARAGRPLPQSMYGVVINPYEYEEAKIARNTNFSNWIQSNHIDKTRAEILTENCKGIFNPSSLVAGKKFIRIGERNAKGQMIPRHLIYIQNPIDYVVFTFTSDSAYARAGQKKVEQHETAASGLIVSSLYETLDNKGINPDLAVEMADVFKYAINFYKIQREDYFKVIFEEQTIDGEPYKIDGIKAILFHHKGKDHYAFTYDANEDGKADYYDEEGKIQKQLFLLAPVKFSRISSRYSKKRFHPVTKKYKAHLGTDFAAPSGTPILSTADGVIVEARYSQFNGNYVKVKHNSTYTTQYLHMSKIAKGMKPGVHVSQGEVIGYVGQTGLATGPHVCYRFWKDGVQVDPYSVNIPKSIPLPKEKMDDFMSTIKPLKERMDKMGLDDQIQEEKVVATIAALRVPFSTLVIRKQLSM